MCGLVAVIAPKMEREERTALATRLTQALAHRGPDHQAVRDAAGVTLGHTRLRVVDPTPAADQPMVFDDVRLAFSGAIINWRSLRAELRQHGVVFRTQGDTEVLLHALRVWGEGALDRLAGMFAFVYHDAARGRVLAARDRMGIKPLVFARRPDGALLVASEAQAIVARGGVPRAVDPIALQQTLRFNHLLGERTFFAGVESVEPGCLLSIDTASTTIDERRYWTLRLEPRAVGVAHAAEDLDEAFRTAVERASDVDVPIGCYLSGGVDSSGIVAELASTERSNLRDRSRLYSLVLPGVRYSEERHIDRATSFLEATTRKVHIDGLGLDDFVDYALRAEMPQWWTSDLALSALAREARADRTPVVLTGEGPDELFAGYDVYRIAPLRPLLVRAGSILGATPHAAPLVRRLVPWLDVDMSIAEAWLGSHDRARASAVHDHFGFHPEQLALWETVEARRPLVAPDPRALQVEHAYFAEVLGPQLRGLSNLERNLHYELAVRLPQWILHMGDRMSSAHGVELRFPYLDDAFVATSLRLPMRVRATLFEDKRVLRRMHRRRLPRAIARRRKQPLYTPTRSWLPKLLSDPRLDRYWSKPVFERTGLLDFATCDAARARLAARHTPDALTGMVDEWLFTFALTTSILAVDACGA